MLTERLDLGFLFDLASHRLCSAGDIHLSLSPSVCQPDKLTRGSLCFV